MSVGYVLFDLWVGKKFARFLFSSFPFPLEIIEKHY
jgi:hypothetical protein